MKLAMFAEIEPTEEERAAAMPGEDLVPAPDAVMDRGFTLPGTRGPGLALDSAAG